MKCNNPKLQKKQIDTKKSTDEGGRNSTTKLSNRKVPDLARRFSNWYTKHEIQEWKHPKTPVKSMI